MRITTKILYFTLGVILGLLLLAGCSTTALPPAPKPDVNLVKVCDTFGAVRQCRMMTEEEAQMLLNRRIIQMKNRAGRW